MIEWWVWLIVVFDVIGAIVSIWLIVDWMNKTKRIISELEYLLERMKGEK